MNAKRPSVPDDASRSSENTNCGGQPKDNTAPMKPMPKEIPNHKAIRPGKEY